MRKGCIFCGADERATDEHVFPQWMGPILASDPRGLVNPGVHRRTSAAGVHHVWESSKILDFKAKRVCRACNGGWMSTIEREAKPIVAAMIKGDVLTLQPVAQRKVAVWLGLKSVVCRYSHSPVDEVDDDWLDYFNTHRRPPDSWNMLITRYDGKYPMYYEGRDITVSLGSTSESDGDASLLETPHGVLMTLIVGYFAAKVLGVRAGVPGYPADRLVPVRLRAGSNVSWPPRVGIDDASLDDFRLLWINA